MGSNLLPAWPILPVSHSLTSISTPPAAFLARSVHKLSLKDRILEHLANYLKDLFYMLMGFHGCSDKPDVFIPRQHSTPIWRAYCMYTCCGDCQKCSYKPTDAFEELILHHE